MTTESGSPAVIDDAAARARSRKAIAAAVVGNFAEWYDYMLFGYLAPTISGLFFPNQDKTVALISAFAVFSIGFLIRPLGGIVFGHLSDRYGRHRTLVTLVLLISVSTMLIGALPTYQSIGVLSPILLIVLRLAQGFSAGGEYGNASVFLTEHAPAGRRGTYAAWLPASVTLAGVFTTGLLALCSVVLPAGAMESWGWRALFLLAGPIGLIGLYLRVKVTETPRFEELREAGEVSASPVVASLRDNMRQIVFVLFIVLFSSVSRYGMQTYLPTYLKKEAGMTEFLSMLATMIMLIVFIVADLIMGRLSDRYGRRPLMMIACAGFVLLTYPAFQLITGGEPGVVIPLLAVFGVLMGCYSCFPATLSELFPARVRVTGYSIGYNVALAAFGGTVPLLSTWLLARTGDSAAPGYVLMVAAFVSLITVIRIPETAHTDLRR
ncbi:MFS transporter [Pseudonocardia acaciae]|uniref:MFS transporter n=1 Tax=Pseudonocardia acaciae TaxID=551276 RepID=UPI0006849BD5|nr:MFS transporter [Pseudonocardia acaciae]